VPGMRPVVRRPVRRDAEAAQGRYETRPAAPAALLRLTVQGGPTNPQERGMSTNMESGTGGPPDAPGTVATPTNGTVVGICGARLTDSERREAREGPRCDRHVIAPRKSGCCDRHKVRLWDEAHPRMGRSHGLRVRQDHTAIRDQILGLLMDGAWWTVWQLAERCRCMETTASSKLRDLRKARFGSWDIQAERVPESHAFRYRLAPEELTRGK
jgi:hypothetical protein